MNNKLLLTEFSFNRSEESSLFMTEPQKTGNFQQTLQDGSGRGEISK